MLLRAFQFAELGGQTYRSNNTWCRRRDSNSHSFRHYPLKIACLPISPRRPCVSVGRQSSNQPAQIRSLTARNSNLNARAFRAFALRDRSTRTISSASFRGYGSRAGCRRVRGRRSGWSRGSCRRWRDACTARNLCRAAGACVRRRNRRAVEHAAGRCSTRAVVGQEGQQQGAGKEHRGTHRRGTRKEIRTAGGTEETARGTTAK